MGRLKGKALPPRLGRQHSRFGDRPVGEVARLQVRDQQATWRQWYKTSRWQKLRLVVLERDLYTCRVTGTVLLGRYPAGDSPVVDHITPHRGDETLFWDPDNLQAVSKAYHDSEKQRLEAGGW